MLILLDRLHMIQVYFITEEGHDRQPLALERPLHQLMPILQILEQIPLRQLHGEKLVLTDGHSRL